MAATHRSKAWRRDANLIIRPINPAGRARLFPLYPASAAEGVGGGLVIESGLYQIMSGAILSLATQRGGPNQRRVGASGQQGLYFHCSLTDGTKSNDGVNSISFSSDSPLSPRPGTAAVRWLAPHSHPFFFFRHTYNTRTRKPLLIGHIPRGGVPAHKNDHPGAPPSH